MKEFNYLKEKIRMLNSLGREANSKCVGVDCVECLMSPCNNGYIDYDDDDCCMFEMLHPDEATAVVRKWAEEHPLKTRQDLLFEKFPNAPLSSDGSPRVCAKQLGLEKHENCANQKSCEECWNIEVDE